MNDDPGRRVAIITGGAGGLGRALAAEMADRGCGLVLADIDAEGLRAAATALRATGAELVSETVDVADPTQVEELINGTQRHFGRIDYLFNNAGINLLAELIDTSLADWDDLIAVNLRGVVHGVHFVYPLMRAQGFGHIVNIASVAGISPTPAEGAYAATKHAVVGLSSALRVEAAAFGVKVSVVCPGAVDTPILRTSKRVRFGPNAITELSPGVPMPPREAAQRILRGVDRGRFFIVLTKTANVMWRGYRWAPEQWLSLARLAMGRIRAQQTDE